MRLMLTKLRQHIDISLVESLEQVKKRYGLQAIDPLLFESIKEYTLRKGKRIRPLLLVLSYLGYKPGSSRPTKAIYHASTCMELLHNFMLIHDDIIDRASLRRGKPTLHRLLRRAAPAPDRDKMGADLSIIAGDIVYALAIDAFLAIKEEPVRKEKALKHFIQTAVFTAMGEYIDIIFGARKVQRISEEDVFLNYTLKTACYTFECPLVVGAILAGAPQKDIDSLSDFGIRVGQAFQIQDDILGIYGSQKAIGKSILSDIAESKKTLLICHAYRQLKSKRRKDFLHVFSKRKKSYRDLVAIRKMLNESGSLAYSIEKTKRLLEEAQSISMSLKVRKKFKKTIWASLISLFNESNQIARDNGIGIPVP